MTRYGRQIEYDLQRELGVDAQKLWRKRKWRKLLSHIDMLPQATQTRQAMLADPEHIAMILEAQEKYGLKASGPPMSEYTPEAARLDGVIDAIHALSYITAKANGAKGGQPPRPQPRPTSIIDDERHRKTMEKSKSVADRFMRRTVE